MVTFHDLKFPYLFPKAGPLRWQSVLRLASDADASVVTNPADWVRLRDAGLREKLRAIPIGSNIRCEVTPGYDRAAQRAKWGAHENWLLAYFGFLNENKGGETLIERSPSWCAAASRPASHGRGQGWFERPDEHRLSAEGRALIGELGLGSGPVDRFHFVGGGFGQPNGRRLRGPALPGGASLRHGSLMAALAHGLPIVSTTLTG